MGERKQKIARAVSLSLASLLLLCGLSILCLGIYSEVMRTRYEPISTFKSLPTVLVIILGIFIAAGGILGIVGTELEQLILIKSFLVISIFMLLLEIGIGVLCFNYTVQAAKYLAEGLDFSVTAYRDENYSDYTQSMDKMQSELKCCGLSDQSFIDWQYHPHYGCSPNVNLTGIDVCLTPSSCCKNHITNGTVAYCVYTRRVLNLTERSIEYRGYIHSVGCGVAVMTWAEDILDAVGLTSLAVTIPQVAGNAAVYMLIEYIDVQNHLYKSSSVFYPLIDLSN